MLIHSYRRIRTFRINHQWFFILAIAFLAVSCRSKKPVVQQKPKTYTPPQKPVSIKTVEVKEEPKKMSNYEILVNKVYINDKGMHLFPKDPDVYIAYFGPKAMEEMDKYGIPASITLAQGLLESGWGTSRLATMANNHFGIKCHDWTGPSISHDDDARGECFRKYNSPNESFDDHSEFLVNRNRYASLFYLDRTDYEGWAHGLKRAGYATNPRYAYLLIDLIQRYNLNYFDKTVSDKKAYVASYCNSKNVVNDYSNNSSNSKKADQYESPFYKWHVVQRGETLYRISVNYNVDIEELKALNKKYNNNIYVGEKIQIPLKKQ